MAPTETAGQPRPEEMVESLCRQMTDLKTPGMAGKVLKVVARLVEEESELGTKTLPCQNVHRCLPAFRELDNMAVTDVVKRKTAESMVLGFKPMRTFFSMLPDPERHNGCEDFDELAELYRAPAEVLAARSRLGQDPFKSFDPDDSSIVELVVESTKDFGTWNMHRNVSMDCGAIAELEGGLARQALYHTPATAKSWYKDRYYSYLRWVAQGRKTAASPLAPEGTINDGTAIQSPVEDLCTLSDGALPGSCASCGSQDASHPCKLCLITLDDHESEHTVSATIYCNEDCRNTHFEAHKTACKEIRKLARSSALFKEAFYQYIRGPSDAFPVSAITLDQGIITKHYVSTTRTIRPIRQLADSQWQADTVMTSFTCNDIGFAAKPMFEFLIRPCCATAEFISHTVKNAEVAVVDDVSVGSSHRLRYNTLGPHVVVRLTLPSGLQYVFDPSAAQFGWKEYLAPWDEYARRRVHLIDMVNVIEPPSDTQRPKGDNANPLGFHPGFYQAKKHVAAELVEVVRSRKGGLRALLKLSDGQFDEAKKKLAKDMEDSVRNLIEVLR